MTLPRAGGVFDGVDGVGDFSALLIGDEKIGGAILNVFER
jgi:hypothetical protein